MSVDIDGLAKVARHAVFDALALAHRDTRRDDAPRGRLIGIGPVDRPEARKHALQPRHHRVAPSHLRPPTPVDVEAEDALDLFDDGGGWSIAVDHAADATRGILPQTDRDRCPVRIRQKRQVKMAFCLATFGRRSMPGPDEARALFERITSARQYLKGRVFGRHLEAARSATRGG